MLFWTDKSRLDDLKDVRDENEALRENERRLERQLKRRTEAAGKAVAAVMRKNDELEAEMSKSQARKDFEAGRITLKEMVLADFAGGREPELVEGRKQRGSDDPPGLLNIYINNLDQPAEADAKRQAIHDNQWKKATLSNFGGLMEWAKGSPYDRALRGELPQGHPYTPGSPAQRLANDAEIAERERRERTKPRRHLYSG